MGTEVGESGQATAVEPVIYALRDGIPDAVERVFDVHCQAHRAHIVTRQICVTTYNALDHGKITRKTRLAIERDAMELRRLSDLILSAAQAIETQNAMTAGHGLKDESAARKGAPYTSGPEEGRG